MNINKGDRVDILSPDGEMAAVHVVPFDLPPGNLLAYYPEANRLTSTARDPRSKTPAFKSIAARIRRSPDNSRITQAG
jgi:anaerobic selenocysteine-containing dehydrogenase